MSITEILKDTYSKYHIEKVETITHTLEKPIKKVQYLIYTEGTFFLIPVKYYLRLKNFDYLYLNFKTYKQAEEYIKKLNKLENGTRSKN